MLRRNQATASNVKQDSVGAMRAEIERAFTPGEGGTLRRTPSLRLDPTPAPAAEPQESFAQQIERQGLVAPLAQRSDAVPVDAQKPERRSIDALRAEIQRAIVTSERGEAEQTPDKWWQSIPPSRIALLVVALLAGGLAAYLATREAPLPNAEPVTATQTVVTQVVEEAKAQILIAKGPIGIGERLTPKSVEWADWPEGALRPEFVTIANAPEAITEMNGSIARFEFFPGEPIRADKLAQPGQGFLSAVLESGMRGVSVGVSAESASGGFIVPSDRVDVVLTRETELTRISDTILHNVRVLAIDRRLGTIGKTASDSKDSEKSDGEEGADNPSATTFSGEATATLELDPSQTEVIVNAAQMGKLTLVLRPIVDTAEASKVVERTTNQVIRISSPFWKN